MNIKHCSEAWKPQPDIEYILDGIIEEGTLTVFYGDGGSGKTYTALSLAACISSGIPFLDRSTKKLTTLYIDEEMGSRMLERRIRYVSAGLGIEAKDMNLFYISSEGFVFSDPKAALELRDMVRKLGIKFIVIDAMGDTMEGDENSKKDVQLYFNNLKGFREDGISLFILHHTVKDLSNYRGSTAIRANADNLIKFNSTSKTDKFVIEFDKTRDGKLRDIQGFKVWGDHNEFTIELGDLTPSEYSILQSLDGQQMTRREIMDIAAEKDIAESTAKKAIASLVKKNKIFRINPDDNPRIEAIYTRKKTMDYVQEICENPPEIEE